MSHPFRYVEPSPEQVLQMSQLSDLFAGLYDRMVATIEPSSERTLAIRSLQVSRMWANVAILGIDISNK